MSRQTFRPAGLVLAGFALLAALGACQLGPQVLEGSRRQVGDLMTLAEMLDHTFGGLPVVLE